MTYKRKNSIMKFPITKHTERTESDSFKKGEAKVISVSFFEKLFKLKKIVVIPLDGGGWLILDPNNPKDYIKIASVDNTSEDLEDDENIIKLEEEQEVVIKLHK